MILIIIIINSSFVAGRSIENKSNKSTPDTQFKCELTFLTWPVLFLGRAKTGPVRTSNDTGGDKEETLEIEPSASDDRC